jgi:hypothetical protein
MADAHRRRRVAARRQAASTLGNRFQFDEIAGGRRLKLCNLSMSRPAGPCPCTS